MAFRDMVQGAPAGVFIALLAVAAAMSAAGLLAARRARRHAAALAGAAALAPGAAAPGYVRLDGTACAGAGKSLAAPLTGKPCLWYRIRVEAWERGADGKASWHEIRGEQSTAPFALEGGGGRLAIEPAGAQVTPSVHSLWHGAGPEPAGHEPKGFLPGENPRGTGLQVEIAGTPGHRFRYREERIQAGDPLFALGEIAGSLAEDEDLDTGAATLALKRPADGRPFLISAVPPSAHMAREQAAAAGAAGVAALGALAIMALLYLRY